MKMHPMRQARISPPRPAIATCLVVLLLTGNACGNPSQPVPLVGEEHEIIQRYETSEQSSDGSSGSSRGGNALLERVLRVREDGLELEYDLPKATTPEERARSWQFPARVFKPNDGAMQLLNARELDTRVDRWLKAGGMTRAACGTWIFTWNAFRIECDPQSVIKTLEAFDLRSVEMREGASYKDAEVRNPGTLTRTAARPEGATFSVVMEVDPDAFRRARADSDVTVGQIMQQPVTLDEALRKRANEAISGTVSVTFETDAAGNIRSRRKVIELQTKTPEGRSEKQTSTEVVERRSASAVAPASP